MAAENLINPSSVVANGAPVTTAAPFPVYLVGGIPATDITVGTTKVDNGTTLRFLYDNAGILGETAGLTWVSPSVLLSGATTTGPDFEVLMTGDTNARVAIGLNTADVPRLSFGPGNAVRDTFLERAAAANVRHGSIAVDTAPIAQTISVQNTLAGGTSNVAGANWTFAGSQGKGTGVGGSFIFQVAPAGSTGTTVNALATALTIDSTGLATFAAGGTFGGAIFAGSYRWSGSTVLLNSGNGGLAITNSSVSAGVVLLSSTDTVTVRNLANNANGSFAAGAGTFTGAVTVPGVTTAALTATGTFTSGAGASVGTLTNAPSAGNPTSWIKIVDNGVTRFIPAW